MHFLMVHWYSKEFGSGAVMLRGKSNHIAFQRGSGRKGIEVGRKDRPGEFNNRFLGFPDPRMSKKHGFFMFQNNRFFYFDAGSKNKSKIYWLSLTTSSFMVSADHKYYHGVELNQPTTLKIGSTTLGCKPHHVPTKSISSNRKVKIERGRLGGTAWGAKVTSESGIMKLGQAEVTKCAFCHDKIKTGEHLWTCPGCKTPIHQECHDELGGCPIQGCRYRRAA